jgi:hypothetical protein
MKFPVNVGHWPILYMFAKVKTFCWAESVDLYA